MDSAQISGEPQGDDGARAVQERPASGHRFENTTTCGNARANYGNQYGDQHHHYYSAQPGPSSLSSDEEVNPLKRLQQALCFPQMGFRFTAIQAAYSQTCQWFFETPAYTRWRDRSLRHQHHGLLWMKGKPGAGKSTITKCAVEHAKANYTDERLIYFFFNARGEKLEKSIEGMLRSLLHQMAPDCPRLLDAVQPKALQEYAQRAWPLDLLKTLFREAANQLSEKASLICYIDAIDEVADEDDVRNMIDFLEDLLETTVQNDSALLVYLASRHYPKISTSYSEEFVLDNKTGHRNDIAIYARSKFRCRQAVLKKSLIQDITQRSSGVFLWVVLVVRDLNKEIDRGNQDRLRSRLDALPIELDDLFRGIFDDSNKDDRLLPALMWVLFAYTAMDPRELYVAILLSTDLDSMHTLSWNNEDHDETFVGNFILSASKGLLEVVQQGGPLIGQSQVVQFIHESVREYLLDFGIQQLDCSLRDNLVGRSNVRLAQSCKDYAKLISQDESLRQVGNSYETDQLARTARLLPFFEYAVYGTLKHNDTAACNGIIVDCSFDHIIIPWLLLHGITEKRAQCLPTPLHILTQLGYANLFKQHLQQYSPDNLKDYLNEVYLDESNRSTRGTALHIALLRRRFDMIELLLDYGADINMRCPGVEPLLYTCVDNREKVETARNLLRHGAYVNACNDQGDTALHSATFAGNVEMIEMLLQTGANPNAAGYGGNTALHIAGIDGCAQIFTILLRHGADLYARNDQGKIALQLVSSNVSGSHELHYRGRQPVPDMVARN